MDYSPLDISSLIHYYPPRQLDMIRTMTVDDLSNWGYTWFSNLIDGDMPAVEEFRDFLEEDDNAD